MSVPVPDRVLLVGDSHGDAPFLCERLSTAKEVGCDLVFQLGDFGYAFVDSFLKSVSHRAVQTGIPLLFIDGNHDNHPWLRQRVDADNGADAPFVEIAPEVFYVPRGSIWTWKQMTFLALGGAYSIDRAGRYLAAADDRVGWPLRFRSSPCLGKPCGADDLLRFVAGLVGRQEP